MVNSIFVRGGVKTNCGRPCSPEGASWLLRVGQNTLGSVGDGTISDQIVESCCKNHRNSDIDVDQPINDVMPEIVPISYPVDVELGQNDSCCVDKSVDCIPCLRSVNNVDAVCSIVYEQENRCSRTVEPLMCTGIDVPVEYICTPNKTLDFVPVEHMGAPNKTLDFVPVEYIGAPIKTLDFVTVEYIYATLGAFLGYICSTYLSIKKLDFVCDCNVTDVEACPPLDYCTDSVQPCSIYYESELCDVRHRSHVVSRNIPDVEACPHLDYCTDNVQPCSIVL